MAHYPLQGDSSLTKNDEVVLIEEAVSQSKGDDDIHIPVTEPKTVEKKALKIQRIYKSRIRRTAEGRSKTSPIHSQVSSRSTSRYQSLGKKSVMEKSSLVSPNSTLPDTSSVSSSPTSGTITTTPRRNLSSVVTGSSKKSFVRLVSKQPDLTGKELDGNHSHAKNDVPNGRIWKYSNILGNIQSRRPIHQDLTVTSVAATSTSQITSRLSSPNEVSKSVQEIEKLAVCSCCGHCSRNFMQCDFCRNSFPNNTKTYCLTSKESDITGKNAQLQPNNNLSISKQTFYRNKLQEQQNAYSDLQGHQSIGGKVFVMAEQPIIPKCRPKIARSKLVEPECLTISSDEEESKNNLSPSDVAEAATSSPGLSTSQESNMMEISETLPQNIQDKECTVHHTCSGHSHSEHLQNELETDFGEEEGEEDDEEQEDEEDVDDKINGLTLSISCRSIRIGSFKVHPSNSNCLPVFVSSEGFSFQVPTVMDASEIVMINLKPSDIVHTLGHFGRCLPILFIYTNPGCGGVIRSRLRMSKREGQYYDPGEKDEKQKRITFLIDNMTDEHRMFLRHIFPGETLLKEIDQKTANEILVRSTPTQPATFFNFPQAQLIKCQPVIFQASPPVTRSQVVQAAACSSTPKSPVVKILTYPPPPQTGGIAITSEDMLCLNEGEFLNDVIIDFYLKYLVNEKLSEVDRQRTHVFSSFFYPRLTQKPSGRGTSTDEELSTKLQSRRHSQVKTWTRHVDIFEKDFIIIPINQNAHWFLAIVCFPGLVPEVSKIPQKSDITAAPRSIGNVTSSNDQESGQVCQPQTSTSPVVQTKDQACNTEGFSLNNTNNSIPMDTSCSASPQPSDHEIAEPGDPEDPLPEAPDSSTHPVVNSSNKKLPCILIFDSLAGPTRWRIANTLREYLDIEWQIKKSSKRVFDRSTMQGFVPRVPQQTNYSDCGVYLLQYVESFFEKPLPHFGSPMPQLETWFPEEKVTNKREQLRSLILELQKQQQKLIGVPVSSSTISDANGKETENVTSPSIPAVAPSQNTQHLHR